MQLGVDGLRLTGRRFGVGRYIEYLLRWWPQFQHPFHQILVYTPTALGDPFPLEKPIRLEIVGPNLRPALWEHFVLPLRKPRDDVFFCPSYVVPVLCRERPVVVTHLGSYEAVPEAFPWWERVKSREIFRRSCHYADVVITVSESSKQDIMRFYGIPAGKIRVIPLGVDDGFRALDDPSRAAAQRRRYFPDGRPFVLFVGKLSKRRHIPELLRAFGSLVRRRGLPHGLVLIGTDFIGQRVAVQAASLGLQDRVLHRPFADHSELVEAYNAADLFVYPSEYEGFGIPVLEAIACGTPTVTLNNSAFPEFAGGIAHFARDGSAEALEDAIEYALFSPELRLLTRREGPRRADAYRWRDIANQTLSVLTEVAKK